ncbi:MAG: TRAM domain-containing protein [Nitrospinae bacterium]|nr:TRAM domain-containing protein [Nitrospinota bacterium]
MIIIRGVLLIVFVSACFIIGYQANKRIEAGIAGFIAGTIISFIIISIEISIRKQPAKVLIGGVTGLIAGLFIANLFTYSLSIPFIGNESTFLINILINTIFGYLGLVIGAKKSYSFDLSNYRTIFRGNKSIENNIKILDTSVIIDGRIADICETGFLEGQIIIPQFILKELQQIADSSDAMKRNRGRRGLDILQKIQKNADLDIKIVDDDFPKIREVDGKLVALCQKIGGMIVTNDFNLNKVAELQGVTVLNINQLANAVKPVVLPGETMTIYILKEGKEHNQGIGYLDDGTMVVVDNARKEIGKSVEAIVSSVLQTTAGRMIFTRLKEEVEREEIYSLSR